MMERGGDCVLCAARLARFVLRAVRRSQLLCIVAFDHSTRLSDPPRHAPCVHQQR